MRLLNWSYTVASTEAISGLSWQPGTELGGQQEQRAGIHQSRSLVAGEADQVLLPAVGDVHGNAPICSARYGGCAVRFQFAH